MTTLTVPITIRVDASGFAAATGAISDAVTSGTNNSAIKAGVQDAAYVYLGFIRRRYSAAEFSPPEPWKDLAPITKYNRLRGAFVRTVGVSKAARLKTVASLQLPILYDTGDLYSSLAPGGAGYTEVFQDDGITVGSSVSYARYHQDGGGRLPRRAILVIPDADTLESMKRSIASGLQTAFNEAIQSSANTAI